MREQKFRIWNANLGRFQNNQYFIGQNRDTDELLLISHSGSHFYPNRKSGNEAAPYLIIQQSTGFKDKNGVEIYEGDFIEVSELNTNQHPGPAKRLILQVFDKALVEWSQTLGGFYYSPVKNGKAVLHKLLAYGQNIKVLGNVYENPL